PQSRPRPYTLAARAPHAPHPAASMTFFSFFPRYASHRALHSFPTRRSSDLGLGHARHGNHLERGRFTGPRHGPRGGDHGHLGVPDRKSTRLNSSHQIISYAVFCLKKKKKPHATQPSDTQVIHTKRKTRHRKR